MLTQDLGGTVRLHDNLAKWAEKLVPFCRTQVPAIAITAFGQEPGSDQLVKLNLYRARREAGAADQVAKVELLVG